MIDIHEDKKQAQKWIKADSQNASMNVSDLVSLAAHGFEVCEDYCGSRERLGQESCFCVRAHFATQEHYFLYLELRRLAKNLATFALAADLSTKTKTQKTGMNKPQARRTNYEI